MSQFTYACPVCSQHIKCDSSESGSVMECPTCYQKIVAPQAPADSNSKFVITGQKYVERKTQAVGQPGSGIRTPPIATRQPAPQPKPEEPKRSEPLKSPVVPIAIAVVIIFLGAGVFLLKDKLFKGAVKLQPGDIGAVSIPGSTIEDNGFYTITGSGSDIWGQADAFHFARASMHGDVTLTVHVNDIQNSDSRAKAGLMIRDSLDPNSEYVILFISPGAGIGFEQRKGAGSPSDSVQNVYGTKPPCWLRLIKRGLTVAAYSSPDGFQWKSIGTTTLVFAQNFYAGLVVCSRTANSVCTTTFNNFSTAKDDTLIVTSSPSVPENQAPAKPAKSAKSSSPANSPLMEDLSNVPIPNGTVTGKIKGKDFICVRPFLIKGQLTLHSEPHGPFKFGAIVTFSETHPEKLAGQKFNIIAGGESHDVKDVGLRWTIPGQDDFQKETAKSGFSLRVEFGQISGDGFIPGKVYLCFPDDSQSFVRGVFRANTAPTD